jgi:deazaflavin-dependent oxidoreductase (nitroreductase family)
VPRGLRRPRAAALDNAHGFAAEHTRRYITTDGADDGWDGPRPILILYTTGRRSGQLRRNPLLYVERAGIRHVIGSHGGADQHPQWYLNLVADPRVHVRVGGDVYAATARTLTSTERAELWPGLQAEYPCSPTTSPPPVERSHSSPSTLTSCRATLCTIRSSSSVNGGSSPTVIVSATSGETPCSIASRLWADAAEADQPGPGISAECPIAGVSSVERWSGCRPRPTSPRRLP